MIAVYDWVQAQKAQVMLIHLLTQRAKVEPEVIAGRIKHQVRQLYLSDVAVEARVTITYRVKAEFLCACEPLSINQLEADINLFLRIIVSLPNSNSLRA